MRVRRQAKHGKSLRDFSHLNDEMYLWGDSSVGFEPVPQFATHFRISRTGIRGADSRPRNEPLEMYKMLTVAKGMYSIWRTDLAVHTGCLWSRACPELGKRTQADRIQDRPPLQVPVEMVKCS